MRRLIDDPELAPELQSALTQARAQLATPDQLVRVHRGVRSALSGGASVAPAAVGAASLMVRGQWLMLVGGGLILTGAIVTGSIWTGALQAPELNAPAGHALTLQSVDGPDLAPARLLLQDRLATATLPAQVEPTPQPSVAPRRVRRVSHRDMPEPASRGLDPQAELDILRRAQSALAANPALGLREASLHARSYPSGVFSQEREMIAIEALLALQRDGAARERAARFLKRYPRSTHGRRVRGLLGQL